MHGDLQVSLNYIVTERLSVYKKISSNFEFKIFFEVGRERAAKGLCVTRDKG